MAYEEVVKVLSLVSKNDLSGEGSATDGRNRFVTLNTDDPATIQLSAADDAAVGVLTTNPIAGQAGRVVISGVVPVLVGAGGVTSGSKVSAGANGVAVNDGSKSLGTALESGAENAIVSVLLDLPVE